MNRTRTFGQKLALGFGSVVALTILIASVSVYALRTVSSEMDRVIEAAVDDLADASALQLALERQSAATRAFLLTGDSDFQAQVGERRREARALLDSLRGRQGAGAETSLLDRVSEAFRANERALDQVLAARALPEADVEALARAFNQGVAPTGQELRQAIDAFVARRRQRVEAERTAANETASLAQTVVGVSALVVALLAAATALVLTRGLVRQLGGAVQRILSSSAELQAASGQQASATREQASAMNEIATTIRELLATSRQIAEGAQRVARIADDTADGARTGEAVVTRAEDAIGDMKGQMDRVVEKMLDLGHRSQQIGGVLEVVGELLEQTNILAINATIEAAGAGEGGKRFAAVAEEIRKLSDRVGASAKEVRGLVDEVRASVHSTVMATETGAKAVEEGTRRFGEVAKTLQQIAGQVGTTTEAAGEIELSTKQQTSAVEQVNAAIANVTQATRETEASTAQTLQTASELTDLSASLSRLVRADA